MLFIDSELIVYIEGQSTLNLGYSNKIFFKFFCSTASLLGSFVIRLEIVLCVHTVLKKPYILFPV